MSQRQLPAFPMDREGMIRTCNEYIEAGVNVENCKRALRYLLRDVPEADLSTDDEPSDLDPAVYPRLKFLKEMELQPILDDRDRKNLRAVMDAYRSKEITLEEGKVMVFWNGVRKTPWTERKNLVFKHLLPCWKEEEAGEGKLWIEQETRIHYQLPARVAFLPVNAQDMHGSLAKDLKATTGTLAWRATRENLIFEHTAQYKELIETHAGKDDIHEAKEMYLDNGGQWHTYGIYFHNHLLLIYDPNWQAHNKGGFVPRRLGEHYEKLFKIL